VLALQRTAGNAAVGGMLQRSRVPARGRSKESLDGARHEFGKRVGGVGSMTDGAGTFT
jgi:hypothetical protein